MIDYTKILKKNMANVLKDVLLIIKEKGLKGGNYLYITFATNHPNVVLPLWLKKKYPNEMTIVIQYEYYNLKINEKNFTIDLSFNDLKSNLKISYDSVISFADPFANFGLKLKDSKKPKKIRKKNMQKNKKNNVVDFKNYKKSI